MANSTVRRVPAGLLRVTSLAVAVTTVSCAYTQTPAAESSSGYLLTSNGEVVRSGSGECVRTGFWQPRHATRECDPTLVAEATPPAETPPEVTAAPEQPPAAQAEIEPAPAEPIRAYVGADAFFGFDEAQLTPRAKQALDRIAERAGEAAQASIRVVGYTDQVGSEDYNLSLSQRRAEAVQSYLLEHGVLPSGVSVEARGESDPIVDCQGRQGDALIECLQPNRRTEIELSLVESPEAR